MHKKYTDGAYTLSDMNDVYNSFDVFLTTSTAEGWGLTLSEAICCKLPVIYGAHTSQGEIAGAIAQGRCRQLTKMVQINDGNAIRYKLNPMEIAQWMNIFWNLSQQYQDESIIEDLFETYDAIIKKYNWDAIANDWSTIIAKLLK